MSQSREPKGLSSSSTEVLSSKKANGSLNDLLERTRCQIERYRIDSTTTETKAKSKTKVKMNIENNSTESKIVTISSDNQITDDTFQPPLNQRCNEENKKKIRGILRKSKIRSSPTSNKNTLISSNTAISPPNGPSLSSAKNNLSSCHEPLPLSKEMTQTLAQEIGIPEDFEDTSVRDIKEEKAYILNNVVERDVSADSLITPRDTNIIHDTVEGYKPTTTSESQKSNEANKLNEEKKENTFEMDMNFTCMTAEDYKHSNQLAQSMGITIDELINEERNNNEPDKSMVGRQTDDNSNKQNGVDYEKIFLGQIDFLDQDEEGPENSSFGDEDDDDFFDFGGEENEEEIELPAPQLRSFMIFWNALAQWITPQAVDLLQTWRQNHDDNDDSKNHHTAGNLVPVFDTSDIGASRCAGLMAMIKMHITRSLKELQDYESNNSNDNTSPLTMPQKSLENLLAQWVRCFDFSLPMVQLKMPMWKAFTTILLRIVIMSLSPKIKKGAQDNDKSHCRLPPSVHAVGITVEEYEYLTQSAISSLQKGSG